MKSFKFLAAIFSAAILSSCGNSAGIVTETSDISVTTVTATEIITEKSVETSAAAITEVAAAESTTTVETTVFDPENAMELCTDNLLVTIEGWVYNEGIRDESACYFFCILEDGTVYTMKYKASEGDTAGVNAFTDKLYSCDNSVWDLAENVKAVGNIFSQMNREMLMEEFSQIDWDSDYYVRPDDEAVPAVDHVYDITFYLYPLRDGEKTAVFAEADGRHILDDNAAEFLRLVGKSDLYREWTWLLKHFSGGDYGAEFKIYTDEQELYNAGVTEIYYSKDYPDIVSRIEGNFSTFKISVNDSKLRTVEQVKNFVGCKSAYEEFESAGGNEFRQVYKGVPVYEGRVSLTLDNEGGVSELWSSYIPNIDIDVNPKASADIAYETLKGMGVTAAGNMELYIVRDLETLEPILARCVAVKVQENVHDGNYYAAEREVLYCFNADTGEFFREITLSIAN